MNLPPKDCPHCGGFGGLGKVKTNIGGAVSYSCGTAIVDGELRLGPNCAQFVKNHFEAKELRAQLEGHK